MRRYSLPYLTQDERRALESMLLEEMQLQTWYSIAVLSLMKAEVFLCMQ